MGSAVGEGAPVPGGTDGNFYGQGTNTLGNVFEVDGSGNFTVLHSFSGHPSDGAYPFGGVIQGSDGNFYRTTEAVGTSDFGALFRMDASGNVAILHSFNGADG